MHNYRLVSTFSFTTACLDAIGERHAGIVEYSLVLPPPRE